MPKNKRKEKKGKGRGAACEQVIEEDVTDDSVSVISTQSEGSGAGQGDGVDQEVDETSAQEDLEEKLKDVIDELSQKSAKGRVDCLNSLKTAFSKKIMEEFVYDRKLTIADALEKCIRKGKGEEVYLASQCFVLLLLQMGAGVDSEELFANMRPFLQTGVADTSAALKGRRGCAEALGLGAFLAAAEIEDVAETMTCLEKIFKASFLKGDGVPPVHSPDTAALHTGALLSWAVLLTIAPPFTVNGYIKTHMRKIPELLQSGDVELRIAAGEVIALLYELARLDNEDYKGPKIDELCDTLKSLATDSTKYRAKKERRQQRSSFRDILRTVENWEPPETTVKFGAENLYIDTWARRIQYDALCHLLGTGMNIHLAENELVRDVFELGSVLPEASMSKLRGSKAERHFYNAAAFKARTKARSKFRDKRSKVVGSDS